MRMALLGASGCGTSVTLKCIAGIMTPDREHIILDGETLKVNGEPKALRPATNGYASLKLPAGEAKIELQGNGRTRGQTLDITKPGTWLVNP